VAPGDAGTCLSLQRLLKHRDHIVALDAVDVEALGPALQNAVVDSVLMAWIGEGEAEMQVAELADVLALVVGDQELLDTLGNVVEELFARAGLELLRQSVLGLVDVVLALFLGQFDLADTQVGAA
jgi:hypothetical protein